MADPESSTVVQTTAVPRKRLLPPIYFLAAVIVMVLMHIYLPAVRLITYPWNMPGIALIILGLIPPVAGAWVFNRHHTTIKPFEVSSALVTAGLHRYSRNPMYLGLITMLIGVAVTLGSLTPWLVIPLFIVILSRRFIIVEERMLAERFGQEYDDYCRRTRRWV